MRRGRVHIHTERCVRGMRRDGVREEGRRGTGPSSNLQGLVSNTIWKETIQIDEGGGRGREGEGGGDKGREVNRSKVTGSRQIWI